MSREIFSSTFLNLLVLLGASSAATPPPPPRIVQIAEGKQMQCDMGDRLRPAVYNLSTARQYPHAVLVFCSTDDGQESVCSGTLVAPGWVLTAIHCFTKCKEAFVYAGGTSMYEVLGEPLPAGSQLRSVARVCEHNTFDVALAMVKNQFDMTDSVNTVQLPSAPLPADVATSEFTAYGRVLLEDNQKLDYLKKTQRLLVISPCGCYYDRWVAAKPDMRSRSGEGNFACSVPRPAYGACRGDSGSGLLHAGALQGVTVSIFTEENIQACIFPRNFSTKTLSCGGENTSSVFVSVYPLVGWIRAVNDGQDPGGCRDQSGSEEVRASPPVGLALLFTLYFASKDWISKLE